MQPYDYDQYAEEIKKMYPDVYKKMMPYVEQAVRGIDHKISENDLNRLSGIVVANSNMANDPPRGHNNVTIGDIAKLLILSALFDPPADDYYDDYYPYYYPYTPPFYFFPFRGGGHRFDGGRGRRGFGGGHGGFGGGRGRR